ncbi:MAG: flagellar brake protein [Clostridiales bacterium]|jgi:c-di-GMP-binding flagellar brake protein YcgR|nr:flagellar brake protein [Clostridiales bacterium]
MDLLDYKVGSRLNLDVYDDNERIIEHEFVSQFEEAISGEAAYLAIPILEGVVYAIRVGWKIAVYMQNGNDIYRFFGRVTERAQIDGRSLMRVERTSEIDVAQRRQFYRFQCDIPFRYRLVSKDKKSAREPFSKGMTVDLSGSGLRFNVNDPIEKERLIECEFTIENRLIFIVGKVMRCMRKSEGESAASVYEVGLIFSEIEERDRDLIIRFIFDEERRRLKKKLA